MPDSDTDTPVPGGGTNPLAEQMLSGSESEIQIEQLAEGDSLPEGRETEFELDGTPVSADLIVVNFYDEEGGIIEVPVANLLKIISQQAEREKILLAAIEPFVTVGRQMVGHYGRGGMDVNRVTPNMAPALLALVDALDQ